MKAHYIVVVAALLIFVSQSESAPAGQSLNPRGTGKAGSPFRLKPLEGKPHHADPTGPENVCIDWIDNFWDFLTVGENGPATKTDFQRFFNYMDNDANGRVTQPQFTGVWMPQTLMTSPDSDRVFQNWAVTRSDNDSTIISTSNWSEVFNYYAVEPQQEEITKSAWAEKWIQDLSEMPNKGCPTPNWGYPRPG